MTVTVVPSNAAGPQHGIVLRALLWVWRQVDPLVALVIGVTAAVLASLDKLPADYVTPLLLSTLSLVAFTIMRDREQRHTLSESLRDLSARTRPPEASSVFATRSSEIPVIEQARHEIWSVQETGSLIVETCRKELIALLERGGRLRLVLTAPTEGTSRSLALRNATLTDYIAIQGRAATFRHLVRDLCNHNPNFAERLEVRYVPYAVGDTFVLTDATHPNDHPRLLFRAAGFGVPFERKLDLVCDAASAPNLFSLYKDQFERMFMLSSKIVLLTGKPKSGKTTAIESLLNSDLASSNAVYSAVSPADMRGDRRTGFSVRTSAGRTSTFATRQAGDYAVDLAVWDQVAEEINEARLAGKVLIIDEIGPMQARSAAFCKAIEAVMDDESASMIATLAGADEFPLRSALLQHYRSTLLHLDGVADRHVVGGLLRAEATGAVKLARMMPRERW